MHATQTTHITFDASASGIRLAGSLTQPASDTPHALVILLSGSGPQDRDQTIAGQKPFLRLRTALAEHGLAALSWDDRGVGRSDGDYFAITSDDLIHDAVAVIDQMRARYPTLPIVLAGHSQGGLIATQVASRDADIAGLALLATSGRPGQLMLLEQHERICQSEGWDRSAIEATLAMKTACFDRLADYPEALCEDQTRQLRAELSDIIEGFYQSWGADLEEQADEIRFTIDDLMEWEWRFLLHSQPAEVLNRIGCPVFAAAGSLDTQINPKTDLQAIESALDPGQCTAVLVPELNHLFQRGQTGGLDEYEHAGQPFHEAIISHLLEWLHNRCLAKPRA